FKSMTGGRLKGTGRRRRLSAYYRHSIQSPDVDLVVIATPDHWHGRIAADALRAGKHVYCERPMTHTVAEALEVLAAWSESGRVMQVGVQRTSDGRWRAANEFIQAGGIGKVVQAQTEYFRNST